MNIFQLFWPEMNDQCQDFARAFQTQLEDLAPGDHSFSFAYMGVSWFGLEWGWNET